MRIRQRRSPVTVSRSRVPARRWHQQRLLQRGAVAESLVSVAGLVGVRVTAQGGTEVGRLTDVVARWGVGLYPAIVGVVVRVGLRHAFVAADQIDELAPDEVRLRSARVDLREYARRSGEVLLSRDVVDHQLLDVDGARVVRASDLYLARVGGMFRLVGADVGLRTFLRRAGPARWRRRAAPERVVDWADVQPFSAPGEPMRLREPHEGLKELRPADLADLLEDLGRTQRQELLTVLSPETAADVLEEMEPDELEELLREAPTEQAAELVARMEPDEAVDALRELPVDDRGAILAAMPRDTSEQLSRLLDYPESEAGGFMTTHLVLVRPEETVQTVRERLRERHEHKVDVDAVVVVDVDGRVIDDVSLFDLLVSTPQTPVSELVGPPWPGTVPPDAGLREVLEQLVAGRRSSLLVVDENGRPLGRILADDVLDALASVPSRRWPWQPR